MTSNRDDIAIVGLSCLFAGSSNVDEYWRNILGKVDSITDPPPEAWDVDSYYDPDFADTDKVYCKRGGYLGSLAAFDPLQYGIPPVAVGGEPDQWLALKLAHDALTDAGVLPLDESTRARTGVVLGKGTYLNGGNAVAVQRGLIIEQTIDVLRQLHPEHGEDELETVRRAMKEALPDVSAETVAGLIPNIIVGRIANRLDLMGPAYTVDAACASSLLAVQLAGNHLASGECDLVIAGGSQVWMPVPTLNVFSHVGALSRTQQIRPFDRAADGTLLGEGIGMVVLKRAADARRDGDRVYAVIKGVGVSSDGRGASVMAPLVDGEELALRRAYEAAGVDPQTLGLLEAHGTGTAVGDLAELTALHRVFGGRSTQLPGCAIGTVKSMISHTIPASGVAGVIKVALALHHRVLPPTLNCDEPTPALDPDSGCFYVNTETRPWIHGAEGPRRAGVNAFGFGGINAHAILEEVPVVGRPDHLPPWDSEVVVIEGEDRAALTQTAKQLLDSLESLPEGTALVDLAAMLANQLGAATNPLRLAIVATSIDDLHTKLTRALPRLEDSDIEQIKGVSGIYFEARPLAREGKVVLLFPGEGSQYPTMLADLCLHFPAVREAFDQVDRIYADHERGHLTSDWIFPRPAFTEADRLVADQRLVQMDIAVEAVLAANEAMFALLSQLNLKWDICLGHSTGEFSAARAAGVLTIDDDASRASFSEGLYRCYAAAEADDDVPHAVLLAVGAGREQVEAILDEIGESRASVVAMDNCPHQVVVVAVATEVEKLAAVLKREGLVHETLPYDRAVHTSQFQSFADSLRSVFADMAVSAPTTPLYSCTTSRPCPDDPAAIRELLVEHWVSPVEFRQSIERLHQDGATVFVECGPRGNLTSFVGDILRGKRACAIASDVQRRSGITQMNHMLAMLAVHDVSVDLKAVFAGRGSPIERVADTKPRLSSMIDLSTRWPMFRLPLGLLNTGLLNTGPASSPPPEAPLPTTATAHHEAPARDTTPMAAHLERMSGFLSLETDIMKAWLGEQTPTNSGPEHSEFALHPLLGRPLRYEPGQLLVSQRTYDAQDDLFLDDHRIGGVLAVMPLTMTMALMAEAARTLVPDKVVVAMHDVFASRWIAVEGSSVEVEYRAQRIADDGSRTTVAVSVRSPLDDTNGSGSGAGDSVVEGVVVLDRNYEPAASPLAPLTDPKPSALEADDIYREIMFHGPCWRAIERVETTATDGIQAEISLLPLDPFHRTTPVPPLPLDPVTLDAAGQLVGVWTATNLSRGTIVFPFRLTRLDLFGPPPASTPVSCLARVEVTDINRVRSDIDVITDDGRPWMRLTGWEDRRFDLPEELAPLVAPPFDRAVSTVWPDPLPKGLFDTTLVECRRLNAKITTGPELWRLVWERRVLSDRERHELAASRLPERRKLERLAGRTAAKEAIKSLLFTHHGMTVALNAIEILTGGDGAPVVEGEWTSALTVAPTVSVSHADGCAVAIARLDGPVGIDIEGLRELDESFETTAFISSERELLHSLGGDRTEWTLRFWCAKEAVAKAIRGQIRHPHQLRVEDADPDTFSLVVTGNQSSPSTLPDLSEMHIVVETMKEEKIIVATTICQAKQVAI